MLNLARVAGETAPLLFTALGNQFWSKGWLAPIATLPVMIYNYAIAPEEDLHQQAWAAGFVLLDSGPDNQCNGAPHYCQRAGGAKEIIWQRLDRNNKP